MRGLVKIGQTTRDSETRADELFSGSSGVADRFEVVYDAVVSDIDAAEEQIHKELQATRFNESREFFRVKIKDAVKLVQRVASTFEVDEDLEANEIEILPRLEERMRRWLRRELVSVKFVQFPDLCILRVTEQPDLTKIEARQTAIDLRVLGDPDADDDLMLALPDPLNTMYQFY